MGIPRVCPLLYPAPFTPFRRIVEPNYCMTCPDGLRGLCCHYGTEVGGVVYRSGTLSCKHLDVEGWCTIYDNRPEPNSECDTVENGIEAGSLPDGCAYVKDIEGYKGRKLLSAEDEFNIAVKRSLEETWG